MRSEPEPAWRDHIWPDDERRRVLLNLAASLANRHLEHLPSLPVSPQLSADAIEERLRVFNFSRPMPLEQLLPAIAQLLDEGIVHSAHPRCFGLFNPTPAFPGILADLFTAAWNPQLAVWSHAPAAIEIETHVLQVLASWLGIRSERGAAHFTSGGAEANAAALNIALTRLIRDFSECGLSRASGRPAIYASEESHLAWLKIAHQASLGRSSVRLVPIERSGALDTRALERQIAADRGNGFVPVLIVATAGTTNAGAIDPLRSVAELAHINDAHYHIDAAWAGAGALAPELRPALNGIELADSVTVDAHKWFAAPMGAGMFFCRSREWLADAFHVTANYMPCGEESVPDPYTHTQQWSRRFIGLKLFLTLAAAGRDGIRAQIEYQTEMGRRMKTQLSRSDWRIINDTPFPIACFVSQDGHDPHIIAKKVVSGRQIWLSTAMFGQRACMRTCITSFLANDEDIEALIAELEIARRG